MAVLTVKNLVRDHTRVSASASYWFCRTPGCDVVYFASQDVFRKQDLKLRVGIKETAYQIPICYCFGYTSEEIRRHNNVGKSNSILKKIKAEGPGGLLCV